MIYKICAVGTNTFSIVLQGIYNERTELLHFSERYHRHAQQA